MTLAISMSVVSIKKISCHVARSYCTPWVGNVGKYSALWLCIVPRANTATLVLNISPYCPPSHAIIYMYLLRCFKTRRESFMKGMGLHYGSRAVIVRDDKYESVMKLYQGDKLNELCQSTHFVCDLWMRRGSILVEFAGILLRLFLALHTANSSMAQHS